MKLSRELKTAILVLSGIVLLIVGFNFLKSNSFLGSQRRHYVVYDHVGGLASGTPVTVNGLSVGTIKDIRFLDNSGKLLVTFTIASDFQFSKNSTAELFDTGIIGGKGIQIIPVFDNAAFAESGDTLNGTIKPGITELVTQKLVPLQEQFGDILIDVDSVLASVNAVIDKDAKNDLKSGISELTATVRNFRKASESVNQLLDDNKEKLGSTLDNVENVTEKLSQISDSLAEANVASTVKDLQKTIGNINGILSQIEKGEGSVGKLLKDDKLYDDLSGASEQLELLLEDLRLNPKRYVHFSLFGKRAKQYKSPEEKVENKQ